MLIGIFATFLIITGIFCLPAVTLDTSKIMSNDGVNNDNHSSTLNAADLILLSTTINIDGSATGANARNWAWAKSQGWCSGSGTQADPYKIENFKINGNRASNIINITNSNDVYFVISNNEIYNSSIGSFGIGIRLHNCSNGEIYGNTIFDTYYGIYINYYSQNIWVHDNQLGKVGEQSNSANIYLYYAVKHCLISENRVLYGACGIGMYEGCRNNSIANNIISDQTDNTSSACGIETFSPQSCEYNLIYGNLVYDVNGTGISLGDSKYNTVFGNDVAQNTRSVETTAGYADYFNNSLGGNYWSDYNGTDANHDGIGDTPYQYNGFTYDYLPLMNYNPVILEKPSDVSYVEGSSVNDLVWNVVDFSFSSLTYDLYRNGDLIQSGAFWYSGKNVSIPITGLTAGTYQYEIIFNDGNSGSAIGTAFVTVTNPIENTTTNSTSNSSSNSTENTTKSSMDSFLGVLNQYSFLISAGTIALAIIIYGIIKKPKKGRTPA